MEKIRKDLIEKAARENPDIPRATIEKSVDRFLKEYFRTEDLQMYQSYQEYCKSKGIPAESRSDFAKGLIEKGFIREIEKGQAFWKGVRIKDK